MAIRLRQVAMGTAIWLAAMAQAHAEARELGRASGNWAGAAGGGYAFDAVLYDDEGQAHLQIWQTMNPEITNSIPSFDKNAITLRNDDVARGRQTLQVVEGPEAAVLRIVSQYDTADGRVNEVIEAQFAEFEFVVTGYSIRRDEAGSATASHDCTLDLRAKTRVVDGVSEPIPAAQSGGDNLWYWGPNVAFDRGLCPAF